MVKAKKSKRVRFWINYRLPGGKQKREYVGLSIEEARTIPICSALYGVLEDIPRAIHDNHVFLYKGKPIRDIRAALTRGCRDAGISYGRGTKDGFVFHDTRHCFNTNMRKSGVPESVIMKITGHSTREMFLRYDTVDATDTRKAVDQMEGFLKSVDQVPLESKKG